MSSPKTKLTPQQQKLVTDNHNLIFSFLHQHNFSTDEWYDLAAIGLCKAAMFFKKDLGLCFSTYAYKVMWVTISNEIKCKSSSTHIPNTAIVSYDAEPDMDAENSYLSLFASKDCVEDEAINKADYDSFFKKQKGRRSEILKLYQSGLTTTEIANHFQSTNSYVSETRKWLKQDYLRYLTS